MGDPSPLPLADQALAQQLPREANVQENSHEKASICLRVATTLRKLIIIALATGFRGANSYGAAFSTRNLA